MSCVTILVLRVFHSKRMNPAKKNTLETKYEGPFPAEHRRYWIVHKPCLMQNKFLVREKDFGELQPIPTSHNLNYDAHFSIWKSGGKYSGTKISSLEGLRFPVLEVSSTQSVAINNKVVLWTFRLWLIWVNRWQTKKLMKWWRKLIATRTGKSALKVSDLMWR